MKSVLFCARKQQNARRIQPKDAHRCAHMFFLPIFLPSHSAQVADTILLRSVSFSPLLLFLTVPLFFLAGNWYEARQAPPVTAASAMPRVVSVVFLFVPVCLEFLFSALFVLLSLRSLTPAPYFLSVLCSFLLDRLC